MAFAETAPPPPAPNLAPPPSEDRGNIPADPSATTADLGDAFADLDTAFGEPAKPAAPIKPEASPAKPGPGQDKPAPAKPGEPQRGPDGKFLPRKDEPTKPTEPKKAEKPAEPDLEKLAPPQLRKAYEELRRKHAALEAERTKAPAPAPAEPQEDPEKQQLTTRLTEREKQLQALEEELRYTAYERSAEYKEKYEQPFISAWQAGQERAARLKIGEVKNEMEEVTRAARQGTAEDFNRLMLISDDDDAAEWASQTFGNKAPMMLYHRERVVEANLAKQKALEDFKKTGGERDAQRKTLIENHTKAVRALYHKSVNDGIEKYPQLFKPDPDDPKTEVLLKKGSRLAERALGAPDIEGEKPMTPQQRVELQAAMRNCFAGFQCLAYRHQKAQARVVELEKMLADYEASTPKGGDGRGGSRPAPTAAEETPDQAFDSFFAGR